MTTDPGVVLTTNVAVANKKTLKQFTGRIDEMWQTAELARTAMDVLSGLHSYAESKLDTQQASAERIRRAASSSRDILPAEARCLERSRQVLLARMNQISENSTAHICQAAEVTIPKEVSFLEALFGG